MSGARDIGAPVALSRISFRVLLPLRQEQQAIRLASQVSNPKSSAYGHYLSAQAFNDRFGPSAATATQVTNYLKSSGFRVSSVAAGNRWVDATGTVSQIESTFQTTLRTYRHDGQSVREATSALSVPSALAGSISGIIGISQTPLHVPAAIRQPHVAYPTPSQCSTSWGAQTQVGPEAYGTTTFPTYICGYTPAQLRTAYGVQTAVSHGNDGHGVTVAIIDAYASSTIVADTNQLSATVGEPAFRPGQYTQTVMGPFGLQDECGEEGWNTEQTLDVQAVHGLAPGANIHYVGAADCDTGIDGALNYVVQNHVADLVSNSYGYMGEDGLGDEVTLEHSIFLQGALEGIGFYFSSGDSGDNVGPASYQTSHPEPDYPASDPLVTAVGGTSLAVNAQNGYLFETSWGDAVDPVYSAPGNDPNSYTLPLPGDFIFGGGGGVSALFAEPLYQRLAVPRSLARLNGPKPMRVVPDVAAVADPYTGYGIVFQGVGDTYGGTSLAAPVFAGIQALASQGRHFSIGFANPLLYFLGRIRVGFHDVRAPHSPVAVMTPSGKNLLTFGQDTSLTATRGYDDTTGLGTPNGPALLWAERLLP